MFTEFGLFDQAVFLLIWLLLNCMWLVLLRRPAMSAALSLALVEIIVVLSQFKFSILWMTINFFDVLIIDPDTIAFLLKIFPHLRMTLLVDGGDRGAGVDPALAARSVPRCRAAGGALGGAVCLAGILGLSTAQAGAAVGAVPGRQPRLELRALRRAVGVRA